MSIPCYHLHDYTLKTVGDVPITLRLFISAFRNAAGEWTIEQVRLLGNPVLWFVDDQGYEAELIRPEFSHVRPSDVVEGSAKRLLREDWPRVCALLGEEEYAGRVHIIC